MSEDKNVSLQDANQLETEEKLQTEDIEIIDQGNNYRFYKINGTFELGCDIYNSSKVIVFSERTQRPMIVSKIDSDLIEIRIGYGTGISGCRYFNVKTNQMSEEFLYVIANNGTKIAYLDGAINNRKIIVKDIYKTNGNFVPFELDFSHEHTPVIEAEFSDDSSMLYITYMKGESYVTIVKTLNLS